MSARTVAGNLTINIDLRSQSWSSLVLAEVNFLIDWNRGANLIAQVKRTFHFIVCSFPSDDSNVDSVELPVCEPSATYSLKVMMSDNTDTSKMALKIKFYKQHSTYCPRIWLIFCELSALF